MKKQTEARCRECGKPLSWHRTVIPITLSGVGYLALIHRSCLPRARTKCRRIARTYWDDAHWRRLLDNDHDGDALYLDDDDGAIW